MKKIYLSVMLLIAALPYISAQEVASQDVAVKTSTSCEFTPVSHWSFGIKGGANYFRISPQVVAREDQFHAIIAGTLEYSINPLVGIGLEYNYNPYGRPYKINQTTTGDFDGAAHDAILYGSISLSNLLVPYRTGFSKNMNVYGNVGVGYSFYNYSYNNAATTNGQGPLSSVGLNVEYNLSKSFSLGVEGQYRSYHRKNIGVISDIDVEALNATIGLRYKFGANGERQHARNISICEYYPKPAPVIIEKIVKDNTIETRDRLKAIEDENAALKAKIDKLSSDMEALSNNEQGVVTASFQNVEFEFGSDKLTESSYSTLDQIAVILIKNPSYARLEVAGHTDAIGTVEFNQTLSEERANAVKIYLLKKHVPAASVSIIGYGENKPIGNNDTEEGRQMNRRVEFKITK